MESSIAPEENQISVWICREEKLVLGLSRRTTCADIVQVLLEEQNSLSTAKSFCIVEKHGGFERVLPNKTKILRLWLAWGEEQRHVKFVLVKSDASLDSHAARSAEARVVRSSVTYGASRPVVGGMPPVGGISPEKQRRVVRKAFRKLEKMKKKKKKTRAAHRDASCAQRMETLVHLVVSQDHTLRQQVQRITHLDVEIDRREAEVHVDRMKRHGVDYVQKTYLEMNNPLPEPEEKSLSDTLAKLDVHARQCAEALRLEEELWEQEALMETMSARIQEELHLRWMLRRRREEQERVSCSGARSSQQNQLFLETERIKTQLDASSYIWLRLSADLESVRGDLQLCQQMCAAREQEMRDLLEEVDSLDMEGGTCGTEDKTMTGGTVEGGDVWMEQNRAPSKDQSVHDDDSDTGLSSLHSQDSDLPVWESLV